MVPKMMMWFFEIVCLIVRANMHSTLVDIEDGSSRAIENVELFVSPNGLFMMVR